jgi:hypothetical protein
MVPQGKQGKMESDDMVEEIVVFAFPTTDLSCTLALKYVGDGQAYPVFQYLSAVASTAADGPVKSDGVVASGSMTAYRTAGGDSGAVVLARILGPQKADAA